MSTTGIILAAGMGKRLREHTTHMPKALVTVHGKPLIQYAIEHLHEVGVDRIVVVGGFCFVDLEKVVHRIDSTITVVENTEYTKQNLLSFAAALSHIGPNESIFVANVDYILLPHTTKAMKNSMRGFGVYASFDRDATTEDCMTIQTDGSSRVVAMSKTLKSFDALYTGFWYVEQSRMKGVREVTQKLLAETDSMTTTVEQIFREEIALGHEVLVHDVGTADWFEIDTPEELAAAEASQSVVATEAVVCSLCGSSSSRVLYHEEGVRVVICHSCYLVYLNPRLSDSELTGFYAERYQKERHNIPDVEAAVVRAKGGGPLRYKKKLDRAREYVSFIGRTSRVLEIGAGYGMLLAAVREVTGASVYGLEPSVMGREVARRAFDVDVFQGDLDAFLKDREDTKTAGVYDLIIMSHVLEHLPHIKESLTKIRQLLSSEGVLSIAVPNILKPDEALKRFFHFEHLYYFSPRTLARTLEESGFHIIFLHERPHEIMMHVVRNEGSPESTWLIYPGTEGEVKKVLTRHALKYRALGTLRSAFELIMPPKWSLRARQKAASFLRACGLIHQ